MTKDGSNARKKAARELAAAEQIPYTEALRRIGQRAAHTPSASEETTATAGAARVPRARVSAPVATLTTDVVLIGHTDRVWSVAFDPDGRTLVSGGDVTVRLWDLAARQTTTVLTGEADVVSVAFSPDGSTVAVADSDRTWSSSHRRGRDRHDRQAIGHVSGTPPPGRILMPGKRYRDHAYDQAFRRGAGDRRESNSHYQLGESDRTTPPEGLTCWFDCPLLTVTEPLVTGSNGAPMAR